MKRISAQFYGRLGKYYPVEEIRMNIRDNDEAIITLMNPKNPTDRIGMHCKSHEFAKALSHYFDNLWKKAKIINK